MIPIDGHLRGTVLSAFLASAPEQRGARTVLTVLLDQSALYGVLEEIGALVLAAVGQPQAAAMRSTPVCRITGIR